MTDKTPRILLVNDDGYGAPGLWALYHRIQSIGEPVIVAPLREQSARSHAVTVRERMAVQEIEHDGRAVGYRVDGMPADCVKVALSLLYVGQMDLVISGINAGSNVGHNILYSGTVAAAIEGAMYGLPALAVSLRDDRDAPTHFDAAACVARALALDVLGHGLPPDTILNVNVPDQPLEALRGMRLTRQGKEAYIDLFELEHGPDGEVWCVNRGGERLASRPGELPLDDLTLQERYVSITPLHFDLTSAMGLETMRERLARLDLARSRQGCPDAPRRS